MRFFVVCIHNICHSIWRHRISRKMVHEMTTTEWQRMWTMFGWRVRPFARVQNLKIGKCKMWWVCWAFANVYLFSNGSSNMYSAMVSLRMAIFKLVSRNNHIFPLIITQPGRVEPDWKKKTVKRTRTKKRKKKRGKQNERRWKKNTIKTLE